MRTATAQAAGRIGLQIVKKDLWLPPEVARWNPRSHLGQYIKSICHHLPLAAAVELMERVRMAVICESALYGILRPFHRPPIDLGLLSTKKFTSAGANFIVDAFQNTAELENFKYHGLGTGVTAESNGDTALVTELTTQYNPDGTRATGTTTEGASANIYRTVGTNTVDGAAAVTEHGVFSQATVGGTLLDRSLFSVINLASGDGLTTTYEWTISPEA